MGFIENINMWNTSIMTGRTAKQWMGTCELGFDMSFGGSFRALVSRWTVKRIRLVAERNGVKFGTLAILHVCGTFDYVVFFFLWGA